MYMFQSEEWIVSIAVFNIFAELLSEFMLKIYLSDQTDLRILSYDIFSNTSLSEVESFLVYF